MLVTIANAAQILGLKSRGALYRKIKAGELPTVAGPDGSQRIESDGLIDLWRQITREQRNSPKPPLMPTDELLSQPKRPAPKRQRAPSRPANDGEVPNFNDERARHERERRMLAELARQEKEGELLRRDDVTTAWQNAVNLTRTKLLGVPSTAKARIPHLEHEEVEVLTLLIREALDELAAGEVAP